MCGDDLLDGDGDLLPEDLLSGDLLRNGDLKPEDLLSGVLFSGLKHISFNLLTGSTSCLVYSEANPGILLSASREWCLSLLAVVHSLEPDLCLLLY